MYVPKSNEQHSLPILHELIKTKSLGAWSMVVDGEIVINHIPFVLHESREQYGTLVGHVSRSNSIWRDMSSQVSSRVVFQGEQAYITPSRYPGKHKHGKAVPSWNYVVAHAL